jgi:CheY-like chemotaxis protein
VGDLRLCALAEMQSRPPDLVVLDVMFPGDDFAGFELARAMCKSPALKRIPILMLTGVNQELGLKFSTYDIDNSWLPVTDFLEKPVDFGMLAGKVNAMLEAAKSTPKVAR